MICTIQGCAKPVSARGWCKRHYLRWYKRGDPTLPTLMERHGLKSFPVYYVWWSMISRCERKSDKDYRRYGARGISVCLAWHDVRAFLADMGHPPEGMTLGRIDNNGDYEPSNCRWETPTQQARNRRSSKATEEMVRLIRAEYASGRRTQVSLAKQFGVHYVTIHGIVRGKQWKDVV